MIESQKSRNWLVFRLKKWDGSLSGENRVTLFVAAKIHRCFYWLNRPQIAKIQRVFIELGQNIRLLRKLFHCLFFGLKKVLPNYEPSPKKIDIM